MTEISPAVGFFMPTIGLSNSIAYTTLNKYNLDTIKHFPPIRVFGTVGFICAMLFVNFTGFQNTYNQLFTSGVLSIILALYSLTLTKCPTNKSAGKKSFVQTLGLDAFKLFKDKQMALFFIFSMFLGVSLQITNGFANPFIKNVNFINSLSYRGLSAAPGPKWSFLRGPGRSGSPLPVHIAAPGSPSSFWHRRREDPFGRRSPQTGYPRRT